MRYIYTGILIFLLASCNNDIPERKLRNIEVDVEIERFDQELFTLDKDTIGSAVGWFMEKYSDFYDIYGYYVIGIGSPGERSYPAKLEEFLTDPVNREVYEEVKLVFPDLGEIEQGFNYAFRRFKYYFPEYEIPRLVSFISGFNYPGFTVSDYLGIGLDMFLGTDSRFYNQLGLSDYLVRNMNSNRIVVESVYNWANELFPFKDSIDNVLSRMVHEGKILYFQSKLFPNYSPGEILGFTEQAESWVINNEEQMWVYLIENKLLYSGLLMDIQKLTGPAPFTSFFTSESPGRAVVYNGYKILKEFEKRNPEMTVEEIMKITDYQYILQKSRYNPKRR